MKKIFILILFFPFLCNAQNQNSIWCFGDSAGIDFSNISNPVTFASGMDGRGSCASIADTNGNLLFYSYTVAGTGGWTTHINNYLHSSMIGADSITGGAWYNELQITPKPDSSNLYYLFSIGVSYPNKGLYYSLVNMNLNAGQGQVVQQNIKLDSVRRAETLQTVKHGNGRDWWVISKLSNNSGVIRNKFFIYLVTPSGISDSTSQSMWDATDFDLQKIIFNSTGNKFMLINIRGFMCEYNFDRCLGIISTPNIIFPEQSGIFNRYFWEGAYSQNDEVFYATTTAYFGFPNAYLLQFNLNAPNISTSCDTLETFQLPIGTGAVRLAPDNRIYFSRAYEWGFPGFPYPDSVYNPYNMNLSVINSPDSLGAACNYQPFSFYLGGKRTYYGLPNNPNYSLGALAGSACDSLTGLTPNLSSLEMEVTIAPNPLVTQSTFSFTNPHKEKFLFTLYDITGRVTETISTVTEQIILNKGSKQAGLYLFSLRNENTGEVMNGKIVIQ